MPLVVLGLNYSVVPDLSPLEDMSPEILTIFRSHIHDLSPLKHTPLTGLRVSIRLFDPEEELLRSLPVESLATASHPAELMPVIEFWQRLEARQQAATDFANDIMQLPVEQQPAAVLARLKELNERGSTLETSIEDGVITQASVGISGEQADVQDEDLSPLRAFAQLRRLDISGEAAFVDLSPLNIAPLETITCSRAIVKFNLRVLRAMSNLKSINGKPANEYLDSVETELWPEKDG